METQDLITCKSCGNQFKGNYCNICGQKVIEGRFTLRTIFHDIAITIFNLEKGFFYTIKQLLLNPGKVIREYINGGTKRYYNPFKLLIIVTGFMALFAILSNTYDKNIESFQNGMTEKMPELKDGMQSPLTLRMQAFLKKNLNIIMLVFIPFYSLGFRIFYRKKYLNYTEHLIINSYAFSIASILSFFVTLISLFFSDFLIYEQITGYLIMFLIFAYFYKSTIHNNFIVSFIKSILSILLGIIFFMVIFIAVTFAITLFLKKYSLI